MTKYSCQRKRMGGVIEREKDLAKWHSAADTKIKAISNCMTKYSRQAKKQWKKKEQTGPSFSGNAVKLAFWVT